MSNYGTFSETFTGDIEHTVGAQELIGFLGDSRSYRHFPATVSIIQTHASIVAVASPYVYKIKKNVNLGFLDYSALEARRFYSEREVELNSRLAHDIYLGITPIIRSPKNGQLMFSETGESVEYAVTMRQIPDDALLKNRLAKKRVTRADMVIIGRLLGEFYRSQNPDRHISLFGTPENIRFSVEENFEQTKCFVATAISSAAYKAIRAYNDRFFETRTHVLERRVAEGRIRECHGDLHLEHIAFMPDGVKIFDCIEFNDRFRCIDIACDTAFLIMDLEFHRHFDLAKAFAETIADETNDRDEDVLNFYKCYRAYVRGKVSALRSVSAALPDNERRLSLSVAKKYFRLATHYALSQSRPMAIFVMGKPASGKSSLAQHIVAETGWKYCSSDITRKELAGVHLFERGSAAERKALYSKSMTERVYAAMEKDLTACGKTGRQIVIDATFGRKDLRARFIDAARRAKMECLFIVAGVSEAETMERLKRREHSSHTVSDARIEDYQAIAAAYEEPDELSAEQKIEAVCSGSQRELCGNVLADIARRSII
ncbi:bifunctional aminoglycoside phosphotransferase/ATP-binding protein [Ignavibacteria bacterium]|nr:AAA family ATPase [Bacteroidota bacterium]MCZ2133367.1 AAA family ATPase [Bacteroidota bacterium]